VIVLAITSIKTGSSFTNLQKFDTFLGPNAAYNPSSFESIATATGTGSSGTITFSSIPSTYKSLQLRILAKDSDAGGTTAAIRLQFNSDTGANYSTHTLFGDGSTVYALGSASTTNTNSYGLLPDSYAGTSNMMGASIIDIIDYASTSKNKTIRYFAGFDTNAVAGGSGGRVGMSSGAWYNTSAISSITLTNSRFNWTTNSVFSLYGVK